MPHHREAKRTFFHHRRVDQPALHNNLRPRAKAAILRSAMRPHRPRNSLTSKPLADIAYSVRRHRVEKRLGLYRSQFGQHSVLRIKEILTPQKY